MDTTAITRQQLSECLESSASPNEKGWSIYHYLKANAGESMPSAEYRSLLLEYLRLQTARPSLLHSLMLTLALTRADSYPDFRLPSFVDMWGVDNLRDDDYKRHSDDKGRSFHSLAERLAIAIMRYLTSHANEKPSSATLIIATELSGRLGFMAPQPMAAVKMFESEHNGRKVRMVKLVGSDGLELSTDWHAFHAKPWEIVGRIYQVLPRRAEQSGNLRVDTIGQSLLSAADVFGSEIGYVDSYDEKHKHYHIFDNASRHFVAESPSVRVKVGDYVRFAPIVPANDPFKSAIVLSVEDRETGRKVFGAVKATVEYVNVEKGYFAYVTDSQPRAFAKLTTAKRPLKGGETVSLIIYQRRGPDGQKRPFVADTF